MATQSIRNFRYDINALRGWAVIAVMLFHFDLPGFSGGFVGVDVFFVISGFLMTSIIVRGLSSGEGTHGFSVIGFYYARAKRILPALIVLCAILLSVGWFTLASTDYRELGSHSALSLAFLSNMKYWLEAGYFDAASHEKWLLHTWSLSVEWQFYLVLPLFLVVVWRYFPGRRNARYALLAAFAASLLLSVLITPEHPSTAFYFFPIRAWEMLAGGLCHVFAAELALSARKARVAEWLGYGLILASIFALDATDAWPGYLALLPVSGALLVLIANRQQSFLSRLRLTQLMGLWSYSVYLWHWPMVVALVFLERQDEPVAIMAGMSASILAGWASYAWIENPARQGLGRMPRWPAMSGLALMTIAVAVPAMYVRLNNGVAGRMSLAVEVASNQALNYDERRYDCEGVGGDEFRSCVYGGPQIQAIVIGDSHASAVVTAVQAALPRKTDGVLSLSYTSCPTIFDAQSEHPELNCPGFNDWAMRQIGKLASNIPLIIVNRSSDYPFGSHVPHDATFNHPTVFFEHRYKDPVPQFLGEFREHLITSVCRIAATRPVYVVRPIPEMPVNVPKTIARALVIGKQRAVSITLHQYHQRHSFIWAGQDEARTRCGIHILDPLPYLCSDTVCAGARNGVPLYYDDNHLTQFGNKLLVPMFESVLLKDSVPTRQ